MIYMNNSEENKVQKKAHLCIRLLDFYFYLNKLAHQIDPVLTGFKRKTLRIKSFKVFKEGKVAQP